LAISRKLAAAIQAALTEVNSDPKHILALPTRRTLWLALGSDADVDNQALSLRRLAKLDIICAEKVLARWHEVFPDDALPVRLIKLAADVLAKRVAISEAKADVNSVWVNIVDERNYDEKTAKAMFAGCAAISAVYSAFLTPFDTIDATLDDDLDPDALEASYFAACSAAGGMNGQSFADISERHKFWVWYLQVGIPEACEA
jgi:Immunity protein Imm5